MSNSFGFGGNNAVLIFSTPETIPTTRAPQPGPVAITGLGLIGPGAVTVREIEAPLPPGKVSAYACGPLADAASLSPSQRRRLSRIIQMGILAARRSHTTDPALRVAIAMGTGYGCVEEGAMFLENMIAKDEREPMPSRFPGSVHNAPAAQIAIDLGAQAMNSAPTMGEISFEGALWQGLRQLVTDEADCALVGAVDELNKYPLAVGQRWGFWTEQTRPGEGAMVARLVRAGSRRGGEADAPATTLNPPPHVAGYLAQVTTVRLGRYRRPFNAKREVDWIAAAVDLATVAIFLSGAQGWPVLEDDYRSVAAELSARAGRTIEHQTYKQLCGEFHSASAFGFSVAVDLVQRIRSGVLLYTLSPRGGKALCCVQP
ncbi:MAG: beta-ketoacyl synthase N-terminal-like domain-containing protein [Verrucomicrobiota bacterium]